MSDTLISREAAAQARKGGVAQRSHRPQQRRSQFAADSSTRSSAEAVMEFRAATSGDGLNFHGLASAYERGYVMYDFFGEYTEVVSAGAGEKSLKRDGLDTPLVLGHDSLRRIASTENGSLTLLETDEGLVVDAPDLDPNDADVRYIKPKIDRGLIREMSFMFRITKGTWSPDYTEYRIEEYDIHRGDVAIVGFGANPFTASELRAAPVARSGRDLIPAESLRLMRL